MANDPFVVVARLLEPYGVTADMLKHKLGHEFHLADYACHLKPGDEVAVNRTKLIRDTGGSIVGEEPLAHWQYGIYVGNGKVVDFGAENTTDAATIAQRSWGRFCGNLDEYTSIRTIRVDWPPNIVRSLKESARIALQIVEMQTTVRQATYNPHNFNCQHLATWCRIGCAAAAQLHALLPAVCQHIPVLKHPFSALLL